MSENLPENRADPVNQDAADWEDAGLPAQEDSTEDVALPADEPVAMDEFGTTGTEREAGEPLDVALSREEPDVGQRPRDEESHAPRLVAEDEGIRPDEDETMVARDAGYDQGAYSPEEQAIHEQDESDMP
ncbi:DUF5709 domain-containing protein [Marinitenerispora sediminis]|uniref:DUF5709 domain-containing protein n=1 Tax=Marinitenerispora sediminis TaxID=1931232 RepID=A0A368T6W3_9ACTN|nr:DUF5709 domain-containing protein [Marinitenerispora sediminis]RCV50652.1 hypothetical protein DEF28_17520 [Marinitenerispora sediminis]RCV56206.1 hypothetical protein DEF23_13005 [Marinitenerispora sediminis]RCV59437.1 hypothetical protein DEF24_09675 [Marinitenerispora sediminis]